MGWKDVPPSDAVEAADWIPGRLHPFAKDVGSVVPTGFDAYARIFHPAWIGARPTPQWATPSGMILPPASGVDVRWSEVAAWAGRTVHPEMQFHAIAAPVPGRSHGPELWDYAPQDGVLSVRQAGALVEILPSHTTTPDDCWLCLWEGYGYFTDRAPWMIASVSSKRRSWLGFRLPRLGTRLPRKSPAFVVPPMPRPPPPIGSTVEPFPGRKRVRLPGRDYLLFKGSIAQAQGWDDGPNLWWPEDRAWCVASEIDFSYSYVGGSTELIDEILRHPALEALPATIDDGVNYTSDKVNA